MPLESTTYINGLVSANPTSADNAAQGDDHIRLIKAVLKASFPNITGPMTLTETQINGLTVSPGLTIKGNVGEVSGNTADITQAQLKNFLGLASAAFTGSATYAAAIHNHDSLYAPLSHVHSADQVNSGVLASARLPAASTTERGAVEKATTAEVTAGATDKFVDAAALKVYVAANGSKSKRTLSIPLQGKNKQIIVAHGHGATPESWTCFIECTSPDGVYQVGDRADVPNFMDDGDFQFSNLGFRFNSTSITVTTFNALRQPTTSGGWQFSDFAKWKLVIKIFE